jgi:hypothetical protein
MLSARQEANRIICEPQYPTFADAFATRWSAGTIQVAIKERRLPQTDFRCFAAKDCFSVTDGEPIQNFDFEWRERGPGSSVSGGDGLSDRYAYLKICHYAAKV